MIDKEYRHLSFQEQQHFVARLKKRRDVESLRAIIELKLDVRCAAMCALIELLSPEDALAYCKQLETSDKAAWVTAFACLPCHPKKTILPYILSKAKSTDPRLRCLCYCTCTTWKWTELSDSALRDADDQRPMFLITNPLEQYPTVGSIAKDYLRAIGMLDITKAR